MKQWEKALMSELSQKARQTKYIDFEDFCKEFGIGTKYKNVCFNDTVHALECWLDRHQEFEFIGDDYEPYWFKSPVLVYTKHLWNADDMTEKRGLELLRVARICRQRYAYEQGDGYAGRAHRIFLQLAEKQPKYYLYSAECCKMRGEMRAEMHYGDPVPVLLKAVKEYRLMMQNMDLLTVNDIQDGNTRIGKQHILSYVLDGKDFFDIYGGEFTDVGMYLYYMLYQCYDELGYKFLHRYYDSDRTDTHKINNAFRHYKNAAECMALIEKNIDKEPEHSFIRDEYKWLYASVLEELIECADMMDNLELAERCFHKITELGEHRAKVYIRMSEIYSESNQPDKVKSCLQLGYDNILAQRRVCETESDGYDEEIQKEALERFDEELSTLQNLLETA